MTPPLTADIFLAMGRLITLSTPELKSPVAVLGFKGWANAGDISSAAVSFLRQSFGALPLAELDADGYTVFTEDRPVARIKDGRLEGIEYPRNTFYYARPAQGPDSILFFGLEPNLGWRDYTATVLDYLIGLGTGLVITVGGTYDERLHTDPPLVSVVADDMVLLETLLGAGGSAAEYDGPISIQTHLYQACRERGLPVVSLWGHAPVYVQNGNFRQVRLIMDLIARLGGPRPELDSLLEAGLEMQLQIEALIERSPKLAAYVQKLKRSPKGRLPARTSRERAKVIPLSRLKPDPETRH